MRKLWLAALVVSAACASAPKKSDLAALDTADARLLEGCYDCLIEARDIYARVGVGKLRPLVVSRLFEAELLMALREKELALAAAGASLERARALAAELPPSIGADRYLAVVAAIPVDETGTPRRETAEFRRAQLPYLPRINGEIAWLLAEPAPPPASKPANVLLPATSVRAPVRRYVALALECAYPVRPRQPGEPAAASVVRSVAADAPTLLRYRAAICGTGSVPGNVAALEAVRKQTPAFVDTSVFLGWWSVSDAKRTGGNKARESLDEAYKKFPLSSAVTYLSGHLNQLIGDCREALRYYDETLALKSLHENALLGRTVCLTYVKRTPEAVAAATRIIDLKLDIIHEGYYWRAWNEHFMLTQLAAARRDIEDAKRARSTSQIHTLAGIIEHDQDDLDISEADLKIARTMEGGPRNCIAAWYLGLVYMKRKSWPQSGSSFESAMDCYEQDVLEARAGLNEMRNRKEIDETFRARQIEGFEAAIKEAQAQQFAAAFNAANYFATAGTFARARSLLDIAAQDTTLSEKVTVLRDYLKDKD